MTPLERYHEAGMRLANAAAALWSDELGIPAQPVRQYVDEFSDACSELARETAQLDAARRRHRAAADRDARRRA
jgi:hypothetical protein